MVGGRGLGKKDNVAVYEKGGAQGAENEIQSGYVCLVDVSLSRRAYANEVAFQGANTGKLFYYFCSSSFCLFAVSSGADLGLVIVESRYVAVCCEYDGMVC